MANVEDIVFIVPIKEGTSQALYLKDNTIVVIDVRTGTVEHVSHLPSQSAIAACEQSGEAGLGRRSDLEHQLPRLPLREIDHTDRREADPGKHSELPAGVERRTSP